jgi:hypothetical protein
MQILQWFRKFKLTHVCLIIDLITSQKTILELRYITSR